MLALESARNNDGPVEFWVSTRLYTLFRLVLIIFTESANDEVP